MDYPHIGVAAGDSFLLYDACFLAGCAPYLKKNEDFYWTSLVAMETLLLKPFKRNVKREGLLLLQQ